MFVQRRAKDANFIGLTEDDAVQLSEILGVPKYLTKSLFNKLASRNATDPAFITLDSFTQVWPGLYQKFNNEEAFAFGIIKDDASSHIVPENLDSIAECKSLFMAPYINVPKSDNGDRRRPNTSRS